MRSIPASQAIRLVLVRALAAVVATAALLGVAQAASVAPVAAENGMVVTAQHLATEVGVDVLRRGGNAVDAAVAVGYALAVVYPAAGNLGGGGFMTLQLADGRKTFLDFREKAPLAATANMYLDAAGNVVKRSTTTGHLAVGVPGTVSGLEMALAKYGTMKRADLIAPAIRFAEQGFVLDAGDAEMFATATEAFKVDPATTAIFLKPGGQPYVAGDRLIQKDLGATLRQIARPAPPASTRARWRARSSPRAAPARASSPQADLDQYTTRELAPVECDYRGFHIVSAPPPSSGGVIICEILNVLEGYPLKDWGFRSAQAVHVQIEAMRHAYVDRNSYLGDPDFVKNPLDRLLDKAYAAKIRAAIDPSKAAVSKDLKPGVAPHEGSNTTHYSIVDGKGNAVSVTYTLNDWFGAKVTAAGTGVLLNDEMDDFTAKLGVPEHLRPGPGRGERDRAGQAAAQLDEPDDRQQGRQAGDGGRHAGRQPHHHGGAAHDHQRRRLRHERPGSGRRAALPPAVAAEPDQRRDVRDQPRHAQDPRGMGHVFAAPQPANHVAAILVGAPSLGGKPVGKNRFYGANDPRRNSGLALGY
jgi:gamma-glutamyltranspeptidase/glutathione hydrolase